jgi:type II secretory pathway pseudopilin PulG
VLSSISDSLASSRQFEMRHSAGGRRGITVTEVLVTIGLISVLLGLLLPAIMAARSSAARVSCSNQLRQIALAASQYESIYSAFPGRRFFIQVRTGLEISGDQRTVALFACPSDRANANGDRSEGKLSYAVNDGFESSKSEHQGFLHSHSGVVKASEIRDGLSNTAMIAERLSFPWYAMQSVAWNERRNDWKRTLLTFREATSSPDEFEAICNNVAQFPLVVWYVTDRYHHLRTPNSQGCVRVDTNGFAIGEKQYGVGISAGSTHPGGVFVGYCDGSVQFVSDTISLSIWRAQGTRSGGEVF